MKTVLLLIPMVGLAMLASGAEPATTNSSAAKPAAERTELSASKNSTTSAPATAPSMVDEQGMQKLGERLALSGALTKAPPSKARTLGELFNPFAPVPPQAESRWLERTAWSTAATAAAGSSTPVETRHESTFGLSLAIR